MAAAFGAGGSFRPLRSGPSLGPGEEDGGGGEEDGGVLEEDDEVVSHRRCWLIGACACILCASTLLLAYALWPEGGRWRWPEGAATAGGLRPSESVRVTSALVSGVRFAPAGIDAASTACPPSFSRDPNHTTRAHTAHVPLRRDAVAALRARAQKADGPSWCAVDHCRGGPIVQVYHLSNVCLHKHTLYALSDRDAPPVLQHSGFWGPHLNKRFFSRYLREVSSERQIPGSPVWLNGTWVLSTPRLRYGRGNIFHALVEDVRWLQNAMGCGSVAATRETRYLTEHGRSILGPTSLGRLWELATDGAGTYYRPGDALYKTYCFERAHVESSGQADGALAACAHLSALARPAPTSGESAGGPAGNWSGGGSGSATGGARTDGRAGVGGAAAARAARGWPDWPAGNASFNSLLHLPRRARSRLGITPANVGKIGGGAWSTPRVTIVHRLENRRILNLEYLSESLRDAGFDVTVVSLECMPLEAQLAVVSNSSTLLGVHGAGLTLGHALPLDALVLELRTAPCTEEAHGVPYQMRKRNQIIPAPRSAVQPRGSCEPPPWKVNSRHKGAIVDIEAVLQAILRKDPVASSPRGWVRSSWAAPPAKAAKLSSPPR